MFTQRKLGVVGSLPSIAQLLGIKADETHMGADVDSAVDSETARGARMRDYTGLADLLWRERELLEHLLFDLAVEQLIVSAGSVRWLPTANRRLDAALEQLRATELARSLESDRICDQLEIATTTPLSEIAANAPEPWASILLEHRESLLSLAEEVTGSVEHNHRLLDAAARSVRETLASITASVTTYDATGTGSTDLVRPSRLDEQA